MPINDYKCDKCNRVFEYLYLPVGNEGMPNTVPCEDTNCKGVAHKQFNCKHAVIFKGGGWTENITKIKTIKHDPYDLVDNDGDPMDLKGNKL